MTGQVTSSAYARVPKQPPASVAVTALGARALGGQVTVGPLRRATAPPRPTRRKADPAFEGAEPDGEAGRLFEALRQVRRQLAEERGVPPYVVFSDASLREMAALRPTTEEDLLAVSGVGPVKIERYGAAFLAVLRGRAAAAGA